ncbi:GPI inositol-deacylase [Scaptodrosophila lebanonensis]|uniref:GPI inositol-deacylase n=1 Tax=Drosophila lebanonensis TaxID=7225 RepID=A0A6J2TR32_DROLE|nr:GPI inositol-deacylase [Scaptodrosophila lebanonensis]
MFRKFAVLLVIGSICCFIYGVGHIYVEVEENACRMTYMFGEPRFAPVRFGANKQFPNYGLYYYYEGVRKPLDPLKMRMTGAPVIFVPGNAGSYKQVRSLASVALRKALHSDSGIHLDYYTIDYDEELSGLYGGYLYHQQAFLKHCIRTVLSLYRSRNNNPSIVLIGHSMGGKVAQSVLTDVELSQHINTIISIATPLDQPVLNLDSRIAQFYTQTNALLVQSRTATRPTAETNVCNSLYQKPLSEQERARNTLSPRLDNVLLISTGGGNRDLLVRSGLTSSQFNDIHAMTSAIPKVSVSCDHLSAVWCLQFMQVINRFLFSISHVRDDHSVVFSGNKQRNLQSATAHFVKSRYQSRSSVMHFKSLQNWNEERRLVINKYFANGLKAHYHELISILRQERYKKLAIEVLNVDDDDWLFGCEAKTHNETGKLFCTKGTPLTHLIQRLPNGGREARNVAILDLNNLRKTYRQWTHVLIRLPPSSKRIGFNMDIYDPIDRTIDIRMPRWYTFGQKAAINETLQGTLHYRLRIAELIEPFQGLRVRIQPLQCLHPDYRITTRLCVPWAAGFERYQTLTAPDQKPGLYINVPLVIPRHYNTTLNPLVLDIYLDPNCRYHVTYEYSYADALARLVLEFYGWLPAHLACVLFIVMKNQVDKFQMRGTFKSLKAYIGYFQFSSLYIVTGCRLLKKVVLTTRILPLPEAPDYSINISIIIHCAAIALSIMAAFGVWIALTLYGNVFYRIALRVTRLSQATSNVLISVMTHLPITFGILTIAVALGSCSGIALIVAFIFYFLMLSNAYKDYLEDYLWQKAANLLNLGGSGGGSNENGETTAQTTETSNEGRAQQEQGPAISKNQTENDGLATSDRNEIADGDDETENDDNDDSNETNTDEEEEAARAAKKKAESSSDTDEPCLGLQNFPFHITLLLMLFIVLLLNMPATLAWARSRRYGIDLPDPCLYPSVAVLGALSLLLQMKAPQKCSGYWTMSVALYLCSGICLLYCQAAIYRLNFVIATAFVLLAAHQGLCIIWREATARFC